MMTASQTTRFQNYTNHKGLALCGHITLDVTARWSVLVNTHDTPAPQRREAVGSQKLHKRLQAANKTQTLTKSINVQCSALSAAQQPLPDSHFCARRRGCEFLVWFLSSVLSCCSWTKTSQRTGVDSGCVETKHIAMDTRAVGNNTRLQFLFFPRQCV